MQGAGYSIKLNKRELVAGMKLVLNLIKRTFDIDREFVREDVTLLYFTCGAFLIIGILAFFLIHFVTSLR